jgi:hypothetical protein
VGLGLDLGPINLNGSGKGGDRFKAAAGSGAAAGGALGAILGWCIVAGLWLVAFPFFAIYYPIKWYRASKAREQSRRATDAERQEAGQ